MNTKETIYEQKQREGHIQQSLKIRRIENNVSKEHVAIFVKAYFKNELYQLFVNILYICCTSGKNTSSSANCSIDTFSLFPQIFWYITLTWSNYLVIADMMWQWFWGWSSRLMTRRSLIWIAALTVKVWEWKSKLIVSMLEDCWTAVKYGAEWQFNYYESRSIFLHLTDRRAVHSVPHISLNIC